jgi:hypothetical protein
MGVPACFERFPEQHRGAVPATCLRPFMVVPSGLPHSFQRVPTRRDFERCTVVGIETVLGRVNTPRAGAAGPVALCVRVLECSPSSIAHRFEPVSRRQSKLELGHRARPSHPGVAEARWSLGRASRVDSGAFRCIYSYYVTDSRNCPSKRDRLGILRLCHVS